MSKFQPEADSSRSRLGHGLSTGSDLNTPLTPPHSVKSKLSSVIPSRPKASHGCSTLVNLPAELRLMILRHLLVSPKPLTTRDRYRRPAPMRSTEVDVALAKIEPIKLVPRNTRANPDAKTVHRVITAQRSPSVQGYHLTPAILRTCQQFYEDGLPVLYHENTLGLSSGRKSYLRSGKMQCGATIMAMDIYSANPVLELYDLSNFSRTSGGGSWGTVVVNQRAMTLAKKFCKFELNITLSTDYWLPQLLIRNMFDQLQPLLSGSFLHVEIDEISYVSDSNSTEYLLRCLQRLRCRSFSITGVDPDRAEAMTRVIISGQPFVDLQTAREKLSDIWELLERYNSDDEYDWAGWSEAEQAVDEGNVLLFETARKEIMGAFDLLLDDMTKVRDGVYDADSWKDKK